MASSVDLTAPLDATAHISGTTTLQLQQLVKNSHEDKMG